MSVISHVSKTRRHKLGNQLQRLITTGVIKNFMKEPLEFIKALLLDRSGNITKEIQTAGYGCGVTSAVPCRIITGILILPRFAASILSIAPLISRPVLTLVLP